MKRFAKKALALLLALLAIAAGAMPIFAEEPERVVRVGYMKHPGFIEDGEDGQLIGYGVDFLNEVCKYTNWSIEYVYASWSEQLEMLRNGEIDLVPMAGYNDERAKEFVFSQQAMGNVQCLLTTSTSTREIYYEDFAHIDGKLIAVQKDSECLGMLNKYAERKGFSFRVWEYDYLDEAMKALAEGRVALIASEQLTDQMGLRIVANVGSAPIYCMTSKEQTGLIAELNAAVNSIFASDVTFRSRLYQKYYGSGIIYTRPNFTREEMAFIASAGEIDVALLPDSQPSAYRDKDGVLTGIVPDLMGDISAMSGLKFNYSEVPVGQKPLMHLMENPELVLAGVLSINPAFKDNRLLVSDDYYVCNAALLANGSDHREVDLLTGDYTIGTLQAFQAMQLYLNEKYPRLKVQAVYKTIDDGLSALHNGEIDLFTYDFHMILHYWGDPRYSDARVVSTAFLEEPQCMVCIKSEKNEILMRVLNKCIATITPERKAEVERLHLSKNTHEPTIEESLFRYRWVLAAGFLVLILITGVFSFASRKAKKSAAAIAQKNIELAEAVQRAEHASSAKSEFLSSMSHDIRTPMNAITGMTEIALRHGDDAAQMRRCLNKIKFSSQHLLALINDILDISMIESGKMSLNVAEFSLVEISNMLIGLTREQAQAKNIDLSVHTHHFEQEHLMGDALRIRQVCINLISNAIKYTPAGGKVDVDFLQEPIPGMPDMVRMTCIVKDNGIGMSKEFQKNMYESFSRATDSRVNKITGSGLGLPICRRIVELMSGTLECESELGVGTTFTASVIVERGTPDEQCSLPIERVLIVDHDSTSSKALATIFERLGVKTDVALSPEEFHALMDTNPEYQAAVVELLVPMNPGFMAVDALKQRFGSDFPILLSDIAELSDYMEQIRAHGVEHILSKPYFYRTVYNAMLPLLGAHDECTVAETRKDERSIEGMQVLVAEDNDMNWEILCEILQMYGVKAERAENGQECLDLLNAAAEGAYEVVMMDGRMPVMNGIEAIRRIRASEQEWIRSIPIIAMTADAFAEDIKNFKAAGADVHMAKPIDVNRLLAILFNLMNKYPISGGG